jgi:hypothetical protein
MTDSTFPLGGPGAPSPPVEDAPADNRRKLVLVGAAAAVLVLLVAVWFLFMRGGSSNDAFAPVPRGHVSTAATHHAAPKHQAHKAPSKVPSTFKDVVGRDPLVPLVPDWVTLDAAAATASQQHGGTGSTAGAPSTTNSSSGTGVTRAAGQEVTLIRIYSKSGRMYAQTKVGDTVYSPYVGKTFAGTFQLLSVKGKTATYLDGDVQFTLKQGQQVLK